MIYYILGLLLLPLALLILGWLILVICLKGSYLLNKEIEYDSPRVTRAIFGLGFLLLKTWRFKYKVINKHYVPESDVVMFGNHISAFDPVVICYELRHTSISGLAKKMLLDIPVFKDWVRARRVIPMDRQNNRKDAEAMIQAIRQAKEGQPMFVFPEGTRSRNGELLPFRHGAFKLALKSEKDLVVFKFTGMNEHKWYHIKRRTCTLEFFEPIKYDEYKDLNSQELSAKVKDIILGV